VARVSYGAVDHSPHTPHFHGIGLGFGELIVAGLDFGELTVAGLAAGDGFGDGPAPNAGAASSATARTGTAMRIDMVRDTS